MCRKEYHRLCTFNTFMIPLKIEEGETDIIVNIIYLSIHYLELARFLEKLVSRSGYFKDCENVSISTGQLLVASILLVM